MWGCGEQCVTSAALQVGLYSTAAGARVGGGGRGAANAASLPASCEGSVATDWQYLFRHGLPTKAPRLRVKKYGRKRGVLCTYKVY